MNCDRIAVPAAGAPIVLDRDSRLNVPDRPSVPCIEVGGGGIAPRGNVLRGNVSRGNVPSGHVGAAAIRHTDD